jgi:hypothetical protein
VLGAGGGEGAEVVAALDPGRGAPEGTDVERPRVVEGPAPAQGRGRSRENPVLVGAPAGVPSGVEARSLRHAACREVGGQEPGERTAHAVRRKPSLGRSARHLARGVHAGVGTACDAQVDGAEDGLERGPQRALDRAQAGLRGPAGEPGPVVLEVEPEGPHAVDSRPRTASGGAA